MKNCKDRMVPLSILSCLAAAAVILLLLFTGPFVLQQYFKLQRGMTAEAARALTGRILCFFYPLAALGLAALYFLLRLLQNIKKGLVFKLKNVTLLRQISFCCLSAAAVSLIATAFYYPFLFIAAAAGFVGLILRVVKNVMQAAVALQYENDLTV